MNYYDVLEKLVMLEGLSGYESKVANAMKEFFAPYADEVVGDRAGNVIAKFTGTETDAPTVMIAAHMDSLGFVIRRIEDNGFLQFDRLGGIPEKVLPALQVSVGTVDGNYIPGIIAVKAHHITPPEEKMKVDGFRSLFIDIGAKSKEEVLAAGIRVGCPVVYKPSFTRLMGDRVTATTLDDRAGCTALVGIAEQLHKQRPKSTTYLVASVWEEFNIRGAVIAARKVKPDICIYLDCGQDGSTPEMHNSFNNVSMEGGPTVCLYNFHSRGTLNGCIGHQGLYKLALECAQEKGLPIQETASLGWLTETAYLQMEGEYVACIDMGYPHRYAHSPTEVVAVSDIEKLAELIAEMILHIDQDFQIARF